jgi:hypothetical protein
MHRYSLFRHMIFFPEPVYEVLLQGKIRVQERDLKGALGGTVSQVDPNPSRCRAEGPKAAIDNTWKPLLVSGQRETAISLILTVQVDAAECLLFESRKVESGHAQPGAAAGPEGGGGGAAARRRGIGPGRAVPGAAAPALPRRGAPSGGGPADGPGCCNTATANPEEGNTMPESPHQPRWGLADRPLLTHPVCAADSGAADRGGIPAADAGLAAGGAAAGA